MVLAPKVAGTVNLDAATATQDLDLFVLFGSAVGAHGNVGQCDYAAANGYLAAFAAERARLVAGGLRRGRTLCLDWPLWAAGGMGRGEALRKLLAGRGMVPLESAAGLAAFYGALARYVLFQVLVELLQSPGFRTVALQRMEKVQIG